MIVAHTHKKEHQFKLIIYEHFPLFYLYLDADDDACLPGEYTFTLVDYVPFFIRTTVGASCSFHTHPCLFKMMLKLAH
jgi:hypothetical protein